MTIHATQLDLTIRHADSDSDVLACFPVLQSLRPLLSDPTELLERVNRQRQQSYRLLAAWGGEQVVGVAGYRLQENLIYGRFLYVDDLVTGESERGSGVGQQLLEQLAGLARGLRCSRVVLDTGMANSLAQRFYFRQGLLAVGMHFTRILD